MCLLLAGCLGGDTPAPRCPRRAFGAHPRVWDGEEMVWMCLPEPSWYLVALLTLQELCRVACPGEVPLLGATLPKRAIPPRWSFSAGLGCVPLLPAPFWLGKPSRGKCLTLAQSPAALPSFWGHLIKSTPCPLPDAGSCFAEPQLWSIPRASGPGAAKFPCSSEEIPQDVQHFSLRWLHIFHTGHPSPAPWQGPELRLDPLKHSRQPALQHPPPGAARPHPHQSWPWGLGSHFCLFFF